MKTSGPSPKSGVNRRLFLRAGATALALPALEAFSASAAPLSGPRNFVAVGTYLGWYAPAFYPKQAGAGYEMPASLSSLEPHRDHFTVFSGLDHRAPNGHEAWSNYLSGHIPGAYSVDQIIADDIGQKARFPSIHRAVGASELTGGRQMSYTKQGVGMPMIERPSVLYRQLFMSEADRERTEYILRSGRSSLDSVLDDAKRLESELPQSDRDTLAEYYDAVRSVEKRMVRQIASINEPVPTPNYKLPASDPMTPNLLMEAEQLMYDLMALAIQTESSHVLTFTLYGLGQVYTIDGEALKAGYHALSHHGNDPAMVHDLVKLESAHIERFGNFLQQLRDKKDAQGKPLLDSTVVMLGTGMGDASRHSNQDLPTLVAGGGFQHGRHLAIDRSANDAPLLGDLFLTVMQRLGMQVGSFSNASRNMNQLFS
jgi:hypothetical protein